MKRRGLRGRRLALVIAPGTVTAVELRTTWRGLRAGRVAGCEVGPPAGDGAWPELEAALAERVSDLGLAGCTADLLLARPFAHAKVATLPPVRRRDLRPLLQRNARRWFPVPEGPAAAEVLPLRRGWPLRGGWRTRTRAGAAAVALVAPEAVARAAADAAAGAGLRVGVVAPVAVALAALALERAGRRARRRGFALVARGAGWAERVVVQGGAPRLLQPLPAGAPGANGIAVEALELASDAAVPPRARRVHGLRSLEALPAAVAAALGARLLGDQPLLLPAALREVWARRVRRRALARAVAAAAVLALAAAVHLRGLQAELDAVAAARRAVAPAAAEARKAREAVAAVEAMLADAREAGRASRRWAELFASIAAALPDSAHLVSFHAQGDELRLGGIATSAAAAAAALTASGTLADVALAGPVRAEGAGERFELVGRLATPGTEGAAVAASTGAARGPHDAAADRDARAHGTRAAADAAATARPPDRAGAGRER